MGLQEVRVLLIDDDEDDFILTRDLLCDAVSGRFTLDWVTDYPAALETLRHTEHTVYLVDHYLGAYNGLDLLREMLASGCKAPIIVLTGQGDDAVGIRALQDGAADYLVKGQIDTPLLERSIRYAIERRHAEEERYKRLSEQAARAEAEAAVRIRDEFLSIAAHELKTPLTSLYGNLQLLQRRTLRDNALGARDQRALQVIIDQAERLHRMIEALLDISRFQTGQLAIERRVVDLQALTLRVVEEFQPLLEHHSLTFESAAEQLLVEGDELRLEQVLHNLLQNAIKYSPDGGVVHVTIERQNNEVCVHIADQGIGIPSEALPNLFRRFYRASNVANHQFHGMGVGLYVVEEIVSLHGGAVNVASIEGQGSTFTICLPLASIVV